MLEAVVLESLRLLPPAYLVGRCAVMDISLAGFTAPKGTSPCSSLPLPLGKAKSDPWRMIC